MWNWGRRGSINKRLGTLYCFSRGIVEAAEGCRKMLQAKQGNKGFQKLPSFSKSCFICARRKKLWGGLSLITTSFFITEQRELVGECCWCDPLAVCVCVPQGGLSKELCAPGAGAGTSEQVSHLDRGSCWPGAAEDLSLVTGTGTGCQLCPVGSQLVWNVLVFAAKWSSIPSQVLHGKPELCG